MYIVYVCKYIDLYEYNLSMALEREREIEIYFFVIGGAKRLPFFHGYPSMHNM